MSIKARLEKLETTKAKSNTAPFPLSYFYGKIDPTMAKNSRIMTLVEFYRQANTNQRG